MQVRYLAAARADLVDIWHFTNQKWSRDQADRYLKGLQRAIQRIAEGRKPTRDVGDLRAGLRMATQGRHGIYLTISDQDIVIVRVLHSSRDAGRCV